MQERVIGRGRELAQVAALLDRIPSSSSAAIVMDGEAGIGKTTIWEEGVRLARERGFRTLVSQSAENESSLPFVALVDLLEPLAAAFQALPAGQRQILEAVRADGTGDQLTVSRATLGLLRAEAERGPLVIAVDDLQWLDPPSERALSFVLRRMPDAAVLLLATRRSTEPMPAPLGLDRAPGTNVVVLPVGPLSLGDLDHVLRERLGVRLPRPELARLHRACGGNPFYAIEIARSLGDGGEDDVLRIPPQLAAVIADRVRGLPPGAPGGVMPAAERSSG